MAEWTNTRGDTDNIPDGAIIMWNGDSSNVPDGWTLCDGTNPDGPDSKVPDLRNRFVVGVGDNYTLGDTGGEKQVQLTEDQMPSHNHKYLDRNSRYVGGYGGGAGARPQTTQDHTENVGGDQPHENRPPYYALTYIMKLGSKME